MRLAVPVGEHAVAFGIVLLGIAAMSVWYLAVGRVALSGMTDLGLASIVPTWAYVGLIPTAAGFAFALSSPTCPRWLAPALIVLTIVGLYGIAPALEGVARFSPSWRHLGVIDYVVRHGSVNPSLDAYQNWPGLFIFGAFLEGALGVGDLSAVALWAPVMFSLLYLPALYLAFSAVVDDRRVVWLAILLFYLGDWIGQDYFSPQAVGLFFYLVIIAVVLRWLVHPDAALPEGHRAGSPFRPRGIAARIAARGEMPADRIGSRARAVLMAAIVAMFLFVVTTHQLTPFFMIAALGLLAILGRLPWLGVAIVMGVIVAAWVAFAAVAFLVGHYQNVAGYVGTLAESIAANLTNRLQGSDDHRLMVLLRLGLTGGLWIAAAVGGLRRLAMGRWDVTAAALLIAPLPLFAVQAYGGEMLLRIALFSLPFTALFVALAIVPKREESTGFVAAGAIFLLVTVMMVGFVVTRYGNERIESFSRDEVAAVDRLYEVAPPGSLLIAAVGNLPWKSIGYESYRYRPNGDETYFGRLDAMMTAVHEHSGPVYLILTRGQEAYAEMILDQPASAWDAFERSIFATNEFAVVYTNPDATLARYVGPVTP